MTERTSNKPPYEELLAIIRSVRNRWRLKIALQGLAIVLGGTLIVFLVGAIALDQFRFAAGALLAFRIVSYLAILALLVRFVVLPLIPRIPDERVALYIEENEPSLEAAIVSAVEMAHSKERADRDLSPQLIKRLVEVATQKVRSLDDGKQIEQHKLNRALGFLGGTAVAAALALLFGPPFFAHSAKLLLSPFTVAEAASPYSIGVEPGDITIARGGDTEISAMLSGFGAERVELAFRKGAEGEWQRLAMTPAEGDTKFVFRLFDVDEETQYYVESNAIRSGTYTIKVADLPAVKQLDLEYIFPAHTGMEPIREEDGGDIAAVAGTTVNITVRPTMATEGGRIIVEGGNPIQLTPGDSGTLRGALRVEKNGFYRVELRASTGEMIKASLDYTIDVITDRAPSVKIIEPGRDMRVGSLEEVFAEASASDDFGVAKLELVYSVNGGEEKVVALHNDPAKRLPEIAAGHTFMLENFGLQPGDIVSYYARATDNNSAGAQTSATDIYFMNVRSFDRRYTEAEEQQGRAGGGGGGGGGGGQQQNDGNLSQQQRDIIAATFKVVRDKASFSEKELEENIATIKLSQERLREAVIELTTRMIERGVASSDSNLMKVSQLLPLATKEMESVEKLLGSKNAQGALSPEQKALVQLQRAEAVYREFVVQQQQQGGGGGGGGGGQQNPEDLADLFELQRDRQRNQYETVDRAAQDQQAQEQANAEVDEIAERLRRLAARQQQENERERAMADSLRSRMGQQQGGGGGGGASQRQLAAQADSMARQLERLARERNNQQLQDAAQRLQQAADAMRRAAASNSQRATAEGNAAAQQMEEVRRLLEQSQTSRAEQSAEEALERIQQLQNRQRAVAAATDSLLQRPLDAQGRRQQEDAVRQQRDRLAQDVSAFRDQLDQMANETRRDQRDASREIQQAANAIRDNRIEDRINYLSQQLQTTDRQYFAEAEGQVRAGLEEVRQRLERANQALSDSPQQRNNQLVNETSRLRTGMQSLAERMQSEQDSARQQQGQGQGQQGQGQQGQGQQGQGQQGQGQQGQGQQGQGQQGQGQQGQGQQGQGQQGQGQQGQGQQGQGQQGQGQQGQGQQGQGQQGQGQQGQGQQGQGQQGQGQQGQGRGGQGDRRLNDQQQQGQQGQGQGQQGGQQGQQGSRDGQQQQGGMAMGQGGRGGPLGAANQQGGQGQFTPEQMQQFAREFAERVADAQDLRRQLAQGGDSTRGLVRSLDSLINNMRTLEERGLLGQPQGVNELQASVVQGLKAFEFAMRRQLLGNNAEKVFLGNRDEVPSEYQKLVEEYYKALSRGRTTGTKPPPPPMP